MRQYGQYKEVEIALAQALLDCKPANRTPMVEMLHQWATCAEGIAEALSGLDHRFNTLQFLEDCGYGR